MRRVVLLGGELHRREIGLNAEIVGLQLEVAFGSTPSHVLAARGRNRCCRARAAQSRSSGSPSPGRACRSPSALGQILRIDLAGAILDEAELLPAVQILGTLLGRVRHTIDHRADVVRNLDRRVSRRQPLSSAIARRHHGRRSGVAIAEKDGNAGDQQDDSDDAGRGVAFDRESASMLLGGCPRSGAAGGTEARLWQELGAAAPTESILHNDVAGPFLKLGKPPSRRPVP